MAALLIVGLLPANALANTSGGLEDPAQKINAYFKTVLVDENGKESAQRIDDVSVQYNKDGWANLGSFETSLKAPTGDDARSTAVNEFKTALNNNTLSTNADDQQNLAFVPNVKWTELKQVGGEIAWHLAASGTVR